MNERLNNKNYGTVIEATQMNQMMSVRDCNSMT